MFHMKTTMTMPERAEAEERAAQDAREVAMRMHDQRARDSWLDTATRHKAAAKRLRAGLEPIEPTIRKGPRKSYAQLLAEKRANARAWGEGWLATRKARQRARRRRAG